MRRKLIRTVIVAIVPVLALLAEPIPTEMLSHANDYVFGYYPLGWRGRDADGSSIFAVQTSSYGLVLNASKATITQTGPLPQTNSQEAALVSNESLFSTLAKTPMTFEVRVGDVLFDAVAAAPKPEDLVIRRLGKYLVNIELRSITLKTIDGKQSDSLEASLILYCWPDRVNVQLHVIAHAAVEKVKPIIRFTAANGLAILNTVPDRQTLEHAEFVTIVSSHDAALQPAASADTVVTLWPHPEIPDQNAAGVTVRATGIAPYTGELTVDDDPVAGWRQILLGPNSDIWTMERVQVDIENPSEKAAPLHLSFSKRGGGFGITGMSPVLCDSKGIPVGLPIQISKNWHVNPAWFDGITVLNVPAKSHQQVEFRLAYAQWGNAPAVAHAQLCLEGWGTHQLWDQMAIGSFGESICYDPDVNLTRSMIDDMRPLMVWGMGDQPNRKWSWTHNVGGADFLVLEQNGKRVYLSRQKSDYRSQGPVLTSVRYVGETPDVALQSQITTQTWRSDDYVRGLYTLRYDVTKPLPFSRLAFFQLAADRYNSNIFATLSQGNLDGLKETWSPEMGGKKYSREHVSLIGEKPWFALTGNRKNPPPMVKEGDRGAWANRGLIIHRWSARLGGKDVPSPFYSVFGTTNGVPSAVVELAPPPDLHELAPGDYVDATVEMLILPQRAEDYYGPNELLRAALKEHPDDWFLVHREAVASNLRVSASTGRVLSQWPVVIAADNDTAAFAIDGGLGYVPVTITGATNYAPRTFSSGTGDAQAPIDQASAVGNDWWQCNFDAQTKLFSQTYAIPFDGKSKAFRWGP